APWFFSQYSTTTPLPHFLTKQLLGGALGMVLGYLGNVLTISVTLGLLAWAFGWTPRAFAKAIAADPQPRRIWRDAVPLVAATVAIFWVESVAKLIALSHWFPWRVASFWVPGANQAVPWLATLTQSLSSAFNETQHVAIFAALVALALRRFPRLTIAALVLYPVTGGISADTPGSFVYDVVAIELTLVIQVLLALFVWRFNPLVIFGGYALSSLIGAIMLFLEKGGAACRWDGFVLLAIVAIAIGAAWRSGRGTARDFDAAKTESF
ncbi:MAG TPA: hypothetical protein VEO95_02985, partial [Chthoniobacteraceae bacterium]|nr:hypothetical protein [Chthoniobacteraceae bacterium]